LPEAGGTEAELNEERSRAENLKSMRAIPILVDSLADEGLPNAQMANAREIICRLDPARFDVRIFGLGRPDPRIVARPNTRLIQLPERRQTVRILREFLWGPQRLVFYMKSSPASRWYSNLRRRWRDDCTTIGTIESQCNLRSEATLAAEAIRLWEQTILRCDHLYSNSASVQNSLEREYGRESEVIPTGVDTHFFTPNRPGPPNPRPRVLFVGSLRAYKQPQLVVEAAARFPDAEFGLAGEGPLADELRRSIVHRGLTNVSLLGMLSAEKLREQYQSSDVFLFPSVWEGSPKVILEAAACGLPVVVRSEYSPETVRHGVTGYQAASNEQIFVYLDGLLKDFALRQQLGRNGRRLSEQYDWDLITRRWEGVFARLAQIPARRAS
jgi:glycosyltransferase involved in cell wall biosynthesis